MARKGRIDRGLYFKTASLGKGCWCVRLYHQGKEQRFEGFPTKTKARAFYDKAKLDQQKGRFFPDRYKRSGHITLNEVVDAYLGTETTKRLWGIRCHANFWLERFPQWPLQNISPDAIDRAKQELLSKGLSHQTIAHYLKFLDISLILRSSKARLNRIRQSLWIPQKSPMDGFGISRRMKKPDCVQQLDSPTLIGFVLPS